LICLEAGSNCRHKDFQSFALPTELSKRLMRFFIKISPCISSNFKTEYGTVFDKPFSFLKYLTLFFKNFSLNFPKSVLFDRVGFRVLLLNLNFVVILMSENKIVLTLFQIVKNLVN
jgi:hypothetical protein